MAENRGEIEGWIGENEVGAVGKQNHGFIDVVNGETEVQRPGEKAIEERSEELVQRLLGFVRIQKRLKMRNNTTIENYLQQGIQHFEIFVMHNEDRFRVVFTFRKKRIEFIKLSANPHRVQITIHARSPVRKYYFQPIIRLYCDFRTSPRF